MKKNSKKLMTVDEIIKQIKELTKRDESDKKYLVHFFKEVKKNVKKR